MKFHVFVDIWYQSQISLKATTDCSWRKIPRSILLIQQTYYIAKRQFYCRQLLAKETKESRKFQSSIMRSRSYLTNQKGHCLVPISGHSCIQHLRETRQSRMPFLFSITWLTMRPDLLSVDHRSEDLFLITAYHRRSNCFRRTAEVYRSTA